MVKTGKGLHCLGGKQHCFLLGKVSSSVSEAVSDPENVLFSRLGCPLSYLGVLGVFSKFYRIFR